MMGNAIFAGIDLGGTNAKVALFDDQLHQIGEKRAPSRATESADIILENLAALLTGLLKETGTDPEDLMALGIGVPGSWGTCRSTRMAARATAATSAAGNATCPPRV